MSTSVHVDEYLTEVRHKARGMEELTSDIPNVSEDATKDLDSQGIIVIGAHIEPGDIMIGKITPKGESDPSPEEKLLKAIFGDKAGDVKDASLKANPSLSGTVIKTALYAKAAKEGNRRPRRQTLKPVLTSYRKISTRRPPSFTLTSSSASPSSPRARRAPESTTSTMWRSYQKARRSPARS